MPRRSKTNTTDGGVKLPPDVKIVTKALKSGGTKTYYYRRSTGKAIEGEPGTLLFKQSWAAAGQADAEPVEMQAVGEVAVLIGRFKVSAEGTKASEDSIEQRQRYLTMIEDRFGHMSLGDIQDDRTCQKIYEWRDGMAKTPALADKAVQTLNQVLKWAKKRKLIKVNQAEDVDKLITGKEAAKRSRSKLVYTPDKEERVLGAVRPCVRNAFLLALFTSARVSDMCRFRWDMIDKDGWLIYTPSKTRNSTGIEIHLPIFALPPLQALLDSLPRQKHGFILSTDFGRRLTAITLKHHWAVDKKKAGTKLHWHDIRGTAITRLLAAGCTQPEVASISGHALSSPVNGMTQDQARSLAKYASANRKMALNAYTKWAEAEFKDFDERNQDTGNVVRLLPKLTA